MKPCALAAVAACQIVTCPGTAQGKIDTPRPMKVKRNSADTMAQVPDDACSDCARPIRDRFDVMAECCAIVHMAKHNCGRLRPDRLGNLIGWDCDKPLSEHLCNPVGDVQVCREVARFRHDVAAIRMHLDECHEKLEQVDRCGIRNDHFTGACSDE